MNPEIPPMSHDDQKAILIYLVDQNLELQARLSVQDDLLIEVFSLMRERQRSEVEAKVSGDVLALRKHFYTKAASDMSKRVPWLSSALKVAADSL